MSNDSSDKPVELSEQKVPWGPWQALLVGILGYFIATLLSLQIASAILPKSTSEIDSTIVIYTASSLILIVVVGGLLKLKHYSWQKFLGQFNSSDLIYLPLFYGLYFVATFLVQFILSLIPSYNAGQAQNFGLDKAAGHTLIGVLVVLVILPPIAEEILFRGLIYRGLASKWGKIVAALITSALFGLAHGQWNVAADTFVLSLVLIFALETTKSLHLPMALHMLKNLVAYVLVFVLHK